MKLLKNSSINIEIISTGYPAIENAKDNLIKYLNLCLNCLNSENGQLKFVLGISKDDRLKYDGYLLKITENKIFILSKEPRGVLYGVYGFLEKYFGVKFIAPDCEICPKYNEVIIDDGEFIDNPSFRLRGAYTAGTRFNKDYYSKLRNHHQFESTEDKYGGDVGWARIEGLTGHNTLCYIKPEEYFNTHPELFSVRNNCASDICLTNGVKEDGSRDKKELDCVGLVAKGIVSRLKQDKTLRYFMVGQQDSWVGNEHECLCERCQQDREKYRSSGVLIRFLNLVSDEVNEYIKANEPNREVIIVGFAYSQTYLPPVNNDNGKWQPIDYTVIPRDNVHIWFCSTNNEINMIYPFADKEKNPSSYKCFEGWKSLTSNIMLWDYGVNFSEYNWFVPTRKSFVQNIRTMKNVNCEYAMVLFGYADVNEWQSLYKGYLASKVLWNTNVDENKVLDEFLELYYGSGGKYVKCVIEEFEKHFDKIMEKHDGFTVGITKSDDYVFNANYYPLSLLDNVENYLNKAIVEIKNSDVLNKKELIKRIHAVMITPLQMKFYNYCFYYKNTSGIQNIVNKIKEYCKENCITAISEGAGVDTLDWIVSMIKEFESHPFGTWDLYRYIYDGFVFGYTLPKRSNDDARKEET